MSSSEEPIAPAPPIWARRTVWVMCTVVAAAGAISGLLAYRWSRPAPPEDVQSAFRLVYATGSSRVVREGQEVEMIFTPKLLHRLDTRTQVLVSVGKTPFDDCHTCAGAFSIAYLTDGTASPSPFVGFGTIGGFGAAPEIELITLGGAPTLVVRNMFSGKGVTEGWASLIKLGATQDDVYSIVGAIPVAYDNAGSADDCAITGKLVAKGTGTDFAVVYTGTSSGEVVYRDTPTGYRSDSPAALHTRCPAAAASP